MARIKTGSGSVCFKGLCILGDCNLAVGLIGLFLQIALVLDHRGREGGLISTLYSLVFKKTFIH